MADHAIYEKTCSEMEEKGYQKKEHILSAAYTNTFGMAVPLPIIVLVVAVWRLRWGSSASPIADLHLIYAFLGMIIITIIHEGIHGLTWSRFSKDGFANIKFGVSNGMPYCHCNEPLGKKGYIIGAAAPVVVLGIVFLAASLMINSMTVLALAALNILLAGGDMLIIWNARKLKDVYVVDHPDLPGFVAFEK